MAVNVDRYKTLQNFFSERNITLVAVSKLKTEKDTKKRRKELEFSALFLSFFFWLSHQSPFIAQIRRGVLIDEVVKHDARGGNRLVVNAHRIEFRLTRSGFGGSAEHRVSTGRFSGSNVSRFVY